MRRGAAGAIALAALWLACRTALAAPPGAACPPDAVPWLRVSFAGDSWTPSLHSRVAEQLGADLDGHRLAVCDAATAPGTAPLADVSIALSASAVLSVEVVDSVTDKRMTRQVALGGVPHDAVALSIALAAEELLHASWIEAALEPPPPPAPPVGMHPVPAVVREVNREEIARLEGAGPAPPPVWVQAALMGAGERSTGGETDLGGDARVAVGGRLALEGEVGIRASPGVQSAHGTVRGREALAGLGLGVALVPRAAEWGAWLGVRGELLDAQFSGLASPGARGASGSGIGVLASTAAGGWRRLAGPWRLVAELDFGVPLRAVTASDAGTTATGISGLSLGAALGVAAALPE